MKAKAFLSSAVALAVLLGAVNGCGSSGGGTAQTAANSDTAATAASSVATAAPSASSDAATTAAASAETTAASSDTASSAPVELTIAYTNHQDDNMDTTLPWFQALMKDTNTKLDFTVVDTQGGTDYSKLNAILASGQTYDLISVTQDIAN